MFTFPVPDAAVLVRFVIFSPEIVQPVVAVTVPEIKVLPPTVARVVNTVY